MNRLAPVLALAASAGLLVSSVVLLPVFEFDAPYSARAAVPSACTAAAGLLLAFLSARRLFRWQLGVACFLLLLHGFLFINLLWHLHANFLAAKAAAGI